jgi:hypothetical protein
MMPLRVVVTLAFYFGISLPVYAQPVPISPSWATFESVEARLRSDDSADVAWGAFLAAEYQLSSLAPRIVERLNATSSEADPHRRHHLTAALLDSLIQLDARVRPDLLLPYYSDWPIQTLVLLGSAGEGRDSALIALLGGATGERWYAIANLLLETKPPGFAARILRDLAFTLSVTVSESPNGEIHAGINAGAGHGHGVGQLLVGFPPYAHYAFGGGRGARVLALGPTPVYYTRHVRNTFQFPVWSNGRSGPSEMDRVRYLREILWPEQTPLYASKDAHIRWTNVDDFRREVVAAKQRVVEHYERFVAALLRQQRLTEGEARSLPASITVNVIDNRQNRSVPLPSFE